MDPDINSLDLLQLVGVQALRLLGEAQGVEGASRVQTLLRLLVVVAQALGDGKGHKLHAQQSWDVEGHSDAEPSGIAAVHSLQNTRTQQTLNIRARDDNMSN